MAERRGIGSQHEKRQNQPSIANADGVRAIGRSTSHPSHPEAAQLPDLLRAHGDPDRNHTVLDIQAQSGPVDDAYAAARGRVTAPLRMAASPQLPGKEWPHLVPERGFRSAHPIEVRRQAAALDGGCTGTPGGAVLIPIPSIETAGGDPWAHPGRVGDPTTTTD